MIYQKELSLLRNVVPALFQKTEEKQAQISYKNQTELVTSSDLFMESEIINAILAEFPEDVFLSEEFNRDAALAKRTWIIDPIDGTSNYAYHLDLFVVQIALFEEGKIVLSYVYAPRVRKEFTAILGQGAFLNGKPIHVLSNTDQAVRLMSMIGISHDPEKNKSAFYDLLTYANKRKIKARMLGSLGYEMSAMAEGSFAMLYTDVSNLWDVAPGLLLIREAGGIVVNERQEPYQLGDLHLYAFCDQTLMLDVFLETALLSD
ncbi:MAG: hypothetical protein PHP32_06020 [Candidatus Izemoplasmatales bacterium]|nr:hypothetical protein [Candidatus Izemoplasmatales bacterium]